MDNRVDQKGEGRSMFLLYLLPAALILVVTGCGSQEDLVRSFREASATSVFQTVLLLATATVVSEDLACISAGVLVSQGVLAFEIAVLGCFLGIVVSDCGLFLIGKWWGENVVKYPPIRWWVTEKRLAFGAALYRKYGGMLVVTSRFLPGTRMICYIAAGMLGYPWRRFALFMILACLAWTPGIVGFAYIFGGAILQGLGAYRRWAWIGFLIAVFGVWLVLKWVFPLFSHDGREIVRGKLQGWFRLGR